MTGSESWQESSKCRTLKPLDSDKVFFPGRGGKINKAETFCKTCPVLGLCLNNAIEKDLDGFFAGTTKDQRRAMARFKNIVIKPIIDDLPPAPKKRRVFRKIVTPKDVHAWLEELSGPPEAELAS